MKLLMHFADYLHTPERKKQNTYGGIGYYRIIKPSEQIKDHEVKVIGKEVINFGDGLEEQWDNIFKQYDVFWTSYFADDRAGAAIAYYSQKNGKKFIIDVDDNYFDVPESNLEYPKFKPGTKDRAYLSTILSLADALTVSTEPLKQRIFEHIKLVHGIEKPIYVIPNMNDLKDWNFTPAEKPKDKLTIGYSGSNSHQDDLRMVFPAIAKIMKKYKHVHLELIGAISKGKIKEYFGNAGFDQDCINRIALLSATPTFREYPKYLSEQKWDIGICPLVDTAFTRSKSHIKWMEYSMYKIPVIASKVYPYYMELCKRDTIRDGETGLLCGPNDWEAAFEKLINNESLRKELGENAYNFIQKEWQYKDSEINDVVSRMLK